MSTPGSRALRNALLAFLVILVCFPALEVAVRVMGEYDADGQFIFRHRCIRPYRLPVEMVREKVEEYLASNQTRVRYHPVMGWVSRPDFTSHDGLYHYNLQGIRSHVPQYEESPPDGILRIALFGDSFTHCDQVPYEETFGYLLEEKLNSSGYSAEVLNFGVSGYAIDQAFLRYCHEGARMSPHLVVFGFQAENIKRNLNLVRPLYFPETKLPFAKPRFILEDGNLELINVPVLPVEELVATLKEFDQWELSRYEEFYNEQDYVCPWWRRSRFLATCAYLAGHGSLRSKTRNSASYDPAGEPGRLALRLIERFAREVQDNGSEFKVVHLPRGRALRTLAQRQALSYQAFLRELDNRYDVVHPEERMLETARHSSIDALFVGHYALSANRAVADELFQHVPGLRRQ